MPKKKNEISQEEQSKRFIKAAKELLGAGKRNRTEADKKFERTIESMSPDKLPAKDATNHWSPSGFGVLHYSGEFRNSAFS